MKPRVLILSASAGAGHVRAGEALEKAFKSAAPHVEAKHVDVLTLTNRVFRHLYSQAYLDFVNSNPNVMGYLFDKTDKLSKSGRYPSDKIRLAFDKLNTGGLTDFLESFRPDLIVHTHFLPASLVSDLKAKNGFDAPHAVVVTDFEVHRFWICPRVDQYFVASPEAVAYLAHLGIPGDRIRKTGIPIDPLFSQHKARGPLKEKLGLDPRCATALVLSGGFGIGPLDEFVEALLALPHPLQVVVVAGRNEEMRRKLEARFQPPSLPDAQGNGWRRLISKRQHKGFPSPCEPGRLKVLGFVNNIDEYMTAADVLVTKPGGLTVSEALAKRTPLVLVTPIPGQETRNAGYLMENGAALKASNPILLGFKVRRLLEDPELSERLRAAAARLATPRAAFDIAETLLQRLSVRSGAR